MKNLKFALSVIVALMLSIICYYVSNLFFSLVSNYAALSLTSISMLPLVFIFASLLTISILFYKVSVRQTKDVFFVRRYSLLVSIFSLLGFVFAILCGTIVYHTFVGRYVFPGYPLFTLIINAILLGLGVYEFVILTLKIKKENLVKGYKTSIKGGFKTFGIVMLSLFAMNRLGALLIVGVWYSPIDGAYVLPYVFQLLVPSLVLTTYILKTDFLKEGNVPFYMLVGILGYSLFSLLYMVIVSHNAYPLTINPLSAIQSLERLTKMPIDFVVMYLVTIGLPSALLIRKLIIHLLNKKEN